MKVCVISSVTTYYPVRSEKQSEIMTIYHIAKYVKETFDSGLNYLYGNDQTIVFQSWNDILFLVCGKNKSPEFLRYQLEIIKNIAIFMFGIHFETNMLTLIDLRTCNLFANYVDKYLELAERFCQIPFGIVEYSPIHRSLTSDISRDVPNSEIPHQLIFVEEIILKDHKVISRTNNCVIDSMSFLMLFLTAYVNYDDLCHCTSDDVDIEYTKLDSSYVYKKGFIKIDGTLSQYYICTTRFGERSPYVAIHVSKSIEPQDLLHSIVYLFAGTVIQNMDRAAPPCIPIVPGTVRYVLVNRTNVESWDHKMCGMDKDNEELMDMLLSSMKSKVFEALARGYHSLMWYDGLFLFYYQQIFARPSGAVVQVKEKNNFTGRMVNLDPQYLAKKMCPDEKTVHVFDVYAIFLKTISPKDANNISKRYFMDFHELKQKMQMPGKKRRATAKSNMFIGKARSISDSEINTMQNSASLKS